MFPPVEFANEDGILALGGNLEIDTLRTAYRSGIFPWPIDGLPLPWFAPPQRALLFFDEFHVGRSLRKLLRQQNFVCCIDTAFEAVIRACAESYRGGAGTWIDEDMIAAYVALHHAGDAHSIEVFQEGQLVGGLYGVACGASFAGESMFHNVSGASKAAVVHLVEHLQSRGAPWLDAQTLTPLFANFGAREIPRQEYMKLLRQALDSGIQLFD